MNEWISAALDGELSDEQRRIMENHLTSCSRCRTMYSEWVDQSQSIRIAFGQIQAPIGFEYSVTSVLSARLKRKDWVRVNLAAFLLSVILALIFAAILVSPIGRLSWSAVHLVSLGVKTSVTHTGQWLNRLLPSTGTLSLVLLCFALAVVCLVSVVQIHRRWRTA